jgi:hypothetical protein
MNPANRNTYKKKEQIVNNNILIKKQKKKIMSFILKLTYRPKEIKVAEKPTKKRTRC